ncbi:MAG: polyphosphate kinase 1 [Solirubrobacteraceae bacterium]
MADPIDTETAAAEDAAVRPGTLAPPSRPAVTSAAGEARVAADLDDSSLYFNRELSWVDFNDRVLQLTEDPALPLLERVKFLAIYCTNLDEFVMVRVAGLHDQLEAGIVARGPDGLTPIEVVEGIAARLRELDARHARQWETVARPALAEHGIRIVAPEECDVHQLAALDQRFHEEIFPVLTPLAVAPGRPFPYISNLSLSLAVRLHDPVADVEAFARVKVPKEVVERFVPVGETTFVPLEQVIARHLDELFPGMEIRSYGTFRVTRDADFTVSDEADDLLQAVEEELRRRRFGEVVRLEASADMEPRLRRWLAETLSLEEHQIYDVPGLLDLGDLWQIYGLPGFDELRDPPYHPAVPPALRTESGAPADAFAAMRKGEFLAHHPYESFAASVERLVLQASTDPDVLGIKQTVYRTSNDAALIPAMTEAAERGKQAVCVVEVKARFDERTNIGWAKTLEEAGAHVVHGLPGLKTHAKALMVVRKEGDGVRRYVHIGTGNYNAKTARIYEDFGLFTTDPEIADDVTDLFNMLTGYARPREFRRVVTSPDHTRDTLLRELSETVEAHRRGVPARVTMKMNSLVDRRCIQAMYEASQAGLPIDLNVRGICCLRPEVPGISETIRVRSVVGRFLEHSRIYHFRRGDERRYYIGSADLMPRNLDERVELLVPVRDPALQDELQDTLDRCLADDTFTWLLGQDGDWTRLAGGQRGVHAELMAETLARAEAERV